MIAQQERLGPERARCVALSVLVAALYQLLATPAGALNWEVTDVNVRFDTTLSQGVTVRASERDSDTLGIANGGAAYSVNHDDGGCPEFADAPEFVPYRRYRADGWTGRRMPGPPQDANDDRARACKYTFHDLH
jgi:hypothetical protein